MGKIAGKCRSNLTFSSVGDNEIKLENEKKKTFKIIFDSGISG